MFICLPAFLSIEYLQSFSSSIRRFIFKPAFVSYHPVNLKERLVIKTSSQCSTRPLSLCLPSRPLLLLSKISKRPAVQRTSSPTRRVPAALLPLRALLLSLAQMSTRKLNHAVQAYLLRLTIDQSLRSRNTSHRRPNLPRRPLPHQLCERREPRGIPALCWLHTSVVRISPIPSPDIPPWRCWWSCGQQRHTLAYWRCW